jgi:hypothetical protein
MSPGKTASTVPVGRDTPGRAGCDAESVARRHDASDAYHPIPKTGADAPGHNGIYNPGWARYPGRTGCDAESVARRHDAPDAYHPIPKTGADAPGITAFTTPVGRDTSGT